MHAYRYAELGEAAAADQRAAVADRYFAATGEAPSARALEELLTLGPEGGTCFSEELSQLQAAIERGRGDGAGVAARVRAAAEAVVGEVAVRRAALRRLRAWQMDLDGILSYLSFMGKVICLLLRSLPTGDAGLPRGQAPLGRCRTAPPGPEGGRGLIPSYM